MAFAADPTTIEPSLEDSFNTVLYTGNGAATQVITGVGFQPDFTWTKCRSNVEQHGLFDSVRGTNLWLNSGGTEAETNYGGNFGLLSWSDDGFTVGNGSAINASGRTYVAWNWKGAELPAINSNGSIPSVVSANPAAGFSIVSYTGNSVSGATVGHGLNNAPKIVIYKRRDSGANWIIKSSLLGVNNYLLFTTGQTEADSGVFWNSTLPTSSVFTLGNSASVNVGTYIAYCFAEVAGFSKFGSYIGVGAAGLTVTTGFRPRWVMIKRTDSANSWAIIDSVRDTSDHYSKILWADLPDAEAEGGSTTALSFSDTGFSMSTSAIGASINASGGTYIYMAFANQF